jgi:1-deoxyxylulose-5-phosphate synthase
MEQVAFGRTGIRVSRLTLGTMTFGYQCDEDTSFAIMDAAVDAGITLFDTADAYPLGAPPDLVGRTEEVIGRWLASRRHDVLLASKCFYPTGPRPWHQGNHRHNIRRSIEGTLRRLGVEHLDLYQIHAWDPHTPIDETLRAMDDLVRSGLVRYIGCSNVLAYQLARSLGRAEVLNVSRFESVQPRYNLLFREIERELLPLCSEESIAVIPYNPLAGGLLTGKHLEGAPTQGTRFTLGLAATRYQDRYWHPDMFSTVEQLRPLAAEAGLTMAQLAVAWVLKNPTITSPILGASRPEQLVEAVEAIHHRLDDELAHRLDVISHQYRFGDHAR